MSHLRRVNEDNVDLNRNFGDHSLPQPSNPEYDKLAKAIAPRSRFILFELIAWWRILFFIVAKGKTAIRKAISGGQYTHPKGLFFGGTRKTWSNSTFRSIVQGCLAGSKSLVLIDFHTGLGKFRSAKILLHAHHESPEYERAVKIWGSSIVEATYDDEAVTVYLDTALKQAVPQMLPNAEVTAVSLEIGTLGLMPVFTALRNENWLHHHGGPEHPKARQFKTQLKRAFHPDNEEWEADVWNHGKWAVEKALDYLGK
jgi:hypothetical protein